MESRRGTGAMCCYRGSKQAGIEQRERGMDPKVGRQSHLPQRSGAIPHPLPRPGATRALAFSIGVRVRGIASK
jgi:hypothetical protein